jgi:hypothetical protein
MRTMPQMIVLLFRSMVLSFAVRLVHTLQYAADRARLHATARPAAPG